MNDAVFNIGSAGHSGLGSDVGASSATSFQEVSAPDDHQEFMSLLDGPGISSGYGPAESLGGTVLDMVRAVDGGRHNMQSKLLRASVSPLPENIFAASVALSKYDLQTLFLSKVANKTFQAVDRLTNLQ